MVPTEKNTSQIFNAANCRTASIYRSGEKGYEIVDNGLDVISSIRDGDWNQFIEYFSSLEAVNPVVRKYQRLNDIIAFNRRIVDLHAVIYKPSKSSAKISEKEWQESDLRFEAILKSCFLHLKEAEDIITPENSS